MFPFVFPAKERASLTAPKEYGVEEVSWKPQFDVIRSVEGDGYVGSIKLLYVFLVGQLPGVAILFFVFLRFSN